MLALGQQSVTLDGLSLGTEATLAVDGGYSMHALNVGGPIVNLGVLDAQHGASFVGIGLAGSASLTTSDAVIKRGNDWLNGSTELATSGNVVNAGTYF